MRVTSTFALMLVCAAAFACPAPGKGPKAERGYAQAQPIIGALSAYHRANNTYPRSLAQLVPAYLDSASFRAPIEYRALESGDYEVSFRYVGPGMNECVYRASSRRWSCSGWF